MDIRSGLLGGGAVKDIVKVENKKFTLKVKKAAPRPTEAGNWKESDAKSTSLPLSRQHERRIADSQETSTASQLPRGHPS